MKKPCIRVAFGSVPKDGGTFTFYRNLRPVLLKSGIDLRCVTVGKKEADLVETAYVDDGCVLLEPETHSVKRQAKAFSNWCQREKIDVVMAINSVAILSALPHLPKSVRVLSRCANGFDEGYRVTLSGRERLMGIVALTPRLKNDLVEDYCADPQKIFLIPNGLDPTPFEFAALHERSQTERPLRLGFMGRLEHTQKGVLYIPKIVRALKQLNVSFSLRIAGKGVHRPLLERELNPYIESGEVELIGAITKDEVPTFLQNTDIFLFTSHFEGCPNALLEAMMAGCAPVSFLIEGITNFLIAHERTGFVAPAGDCQTFAGYIARMAKNRDMMHQISSATAEEARDRFTSQVAAMKYTQLFRSTMQAPLPAFEPVPWSQFKVDSVYRKRWTAYAPKPLRNFVKNVMSLQASAS